MARSRIVAADRFEPDFGLPFDPKRAERLANLPQDELMRLAEFKAWMLSGEGVTGAEVQNRLAAMPRHLQPHGLAIWADENSPLDPVGFGWNLPAWYEVMQAWRAYRVHCIFGGNRSSKSVFAARLFVWLLLNIPEARLRCFQVNDDKSQSEQQAYVWEALPAKFKNFSRKRGQTHNLQYTQKNGFVGGKLIVPPMWGYTRGGEITFGTYQQYRNDPQVVEGWWAHAIWCDEEVPQKMFERLITRLFDARGRMVLTFTTIQGWSPLVADILGRTKTLRTRMSTLLEREIPVAQESLSRPFAPEGTPSQTRIYYFWTQDNAFIPPDSVDAMRGRPSEEILAICHGIPTKAGLCKFPGFDETVHVIAHEKLPWLLPDYDPLDEKAAEFTRYHVIDPGGSKPWFMLWLAVDSGGKIYVYREFPDESFGNWGEPGDGPEGKAGEAQRPLGWGFTDYADLFKEVEQGETIFERFIDPRMGAAQSAAKEGATSIISELEAIGITTIPAPGLTLDHGEALINDRLKFDHTKPVGPLNTPRLFISECCVNLIAALKNYTRASKEEVWKDPVDCLRYALEAGADHIAKENLTNTRRTFSY